MLFPCPLPTSIGVLEENAIEKRFMLLLYGVWMERSISKHSSVQDTAVVSARGGDMAPALPIEANNNNNHMDVKDAFC